MSWPHISSPSKWTKKKMHMPNNNQGKIQPVQEVKSQVISRETLHMSSSKLAASRRSQDIINKQSNTTASSRTAAAQHNNTQVSTNSRKKLTLKKWKGWFRTFGLLPNRKVWFRFEVPFEATAALIKAKPTESAAAPTSSFVHKSLLKAHVGRQPVFMSMYMSCSSSSCLQQCFSSI